MRRGAVLVMVALALHAVAAGTGWAHGEDGTFAGLDAQPDAEPLAVSVRARLVYLNDAEPAPGATIVVEAIGPDGIAAAASPALADEGDGTYAGSLTLPAAGAWTLRFTATTPNATAETTYTATAPTTTAPTTSTAPEPIRQTAADDGGGGGSGILLVAVAAVVLVVLAGGGALLWRRRANAS